MIWYNGPDCIEPPRLAPKKWLSKEISFRFIIRADSITAFHDGRNSPGHHCYQYSKRTVQRKFSLCASYILSMDYSFLMLNSSCVNGIFIMIASKQNEGEIAI